MASNKIFRQFGLWDSPISALSQARGILLADVAWDEEGNLLWLENRSDRGVMMIAPPDGSATREFNCEFSVRAKVGYGGGNFCVGKGHVYFVEAETNRIYRQPIQQGSAKVLTPGFGKSASPTISPDGSWLIFVRTYEDQDTLEVVDIEGAYWPQKLVTGDDFYMQPTWHPGNQQIAWVAWNHPNMPWDGTELHLGKLSLAPERLPILESTELVAGDEQTAIFQPQFSPDGKYLAYVSDASGWWQIYLYDLLSGKSKQITHAEAEHGEPAWCQGQRTYSFSSDSQHIFFLRNTIGLTSLWQYELVSGKEKKVEIDAVYSHMEQICVRTGKIALIASGDRIPERIITCQIGEGGAGGSVMVKQRSTSEELPMQAYSKPETIQWEGLHGGVVHGLYYPPHNEKFRGIGKPPLIVHIHGGPTSQVRNWFNNRAQFFTSRGYAVLEVNYRGSTGYGRAYRNLLRNEWGIFDVQDAVSGAQFLVTRELVDKDRVVIMGGSAGGFTVLKALEDYPGFFKTGICLYGVSNQFTMAADTHKFEAHYLDSLIGPLPDASAIYRERSPIFFVDQIQDPIAIFQGEDDQVVPRDQSDTVVESLERRGVAHIYHVYPGEGHGFRRNETIEHYYLEVEKFLRQHVIYS